MSEDPWDALIQRTEDPKAREIIKQAANAYHLAVKGHNQMTAGIKKMFQLQYDLLDFLTSKPTSGGKDS